MVTHSFSFFDKRQEQHEEDCDKTQTEMLQEQNGTERNKWKEQSQLQSQLQTWNTNYHKFNRALESHRYNCINLVRFHTNTLRRHRIRHTWHKHSVIRHLFKLIEFILVYIGVPADSKFRCKRILLHMFELLFRFFPIGLNLHHFAHVMFKLQAYYEHNVSTSLDGGWQLSLYISNI